MVKKHITIRYPEEIIEKLCEKYPNIGFTDILIDLGIKDLNHNQYEMLDTACPRLRILSDGFYYCIREEAKKNKISKDIDDTDKMCKVCEYIAGFRKDFKENKEIREKGFIGTYPVCRHPNFPTVGKYDENKNSFYCPITLEWRTVDKTCKILIKGANCKYLDWATVIAKPK